jgi:hypothetical protein
MYPHHTATLPGALGAASAPGAFDPNFRGPHPRSPEPPAAVSSGKPKGSRAELAATYAGDGGRTNGPRRSAAATHDKGKMAP